MNFRSLIALLKEAKAFITANAPDALFRMSDFLLVLANATKEASTIFNGGQSTDSVAVDSETSHLDAEAFSEELENMNNELIRLAGRVGAENTFGTKQKPVSLPGAFKVGMTKILRTVVDHLRNKLKHMGSAATSSQQEQPKESEIQVPGDFGGDNEFTAE